MKIAFFCDTNLLNYTTNPEQYVYLHGKHSSTGYYFWILKNHGVKNIALISNEDELSSFDAVVFHYDDFKQIQHFKGKKIQVVTDRPALDFCDIFVAANSTFTTRVKDTQVISTYGLTNTLNTWVENKDKWYFVHYPPTYGVKRCTANFPPKNYKFVGREHTLINEITQPKFIEKCKQHNIILQFDYTSDANDGTEDVYFCVRKVRCISKATNHENNSGKYGHKTANRLYQGWYMRTPCILNNAPEMAVLKETEYDFLIANNADEFFTQACRLKNDEQLFKSMIEHSKCKDSINPYCNLQIVVDQWLYVFSKLSTHF